jgi:Mn2+/Fe2+ NRAMP family transporter
MLLWIVGLSSGMAIVLKIIAARLSVVTGKETPGPLPPQWSRFRG